MIPKRPTRRGSRGRAARHPFYEVWVALISQHPMVNTLRSNDAILWFLSNAALQKSHIYQKYIPSLNEAFFLAPNEAQGVTLPVCVSLQ